MKVTPEFIVSFETKIDGLSTGNWQRVAANLKWDKIMKRRSGATKKELLTWLLETAKLYPEGPDGGNTRYDDIVAATHSLEHEHFGNGLQLTRDEIEDNQMANNPTVGALDYASKWAKDIGSARAYHPQQQLAALILAGKVTNGYDGVPFFGTTHPLNPNGGGGTYSNLISAVPINAVAGNPPDDVNSLILAQRNLAKALAAVSGQRFLGGIPRFLKPMGIVHPTQLQYRVNQLTGGEVLSQTTNVMKKDALESIWMPELDGEPDVYYIAVEDILSDELGAFAHSIRNEFQISMYGWMDQLVLGRMNEFEWLAKLRTTTIYGHPYLFYRCEPT